MTIGNSEILFQSASNRTWRRALRGLGALTLSALLTCGPVPPGTAGEPGNADSDWYMEKLEKREKKSREERAREELEGRVAAFLPRADSATRELRSVTWPAPAPQWPTVRDVLQRAEQLSQEIKASPAWTASSPPNSSFVALSDTLAATKSRILATAAESFSDYRPNSTMSFFEAYPIKLTAEVFRANAASWDLQLSAIPPAQIVQIRNHYGSELPHEFGQKLALAHYRSGVRALAGTEDGASLQVVLRALQSTRDSGFDIGKIQSPRIVVAEVAATQPAGDFKTALAHDLPFHAIKGTFDVVTADPAASSADVLVLLQVLSSTVDRTIGNYETVQSEYQSGSTVVPNPSYAAAQATVNAATINYQQKALNSSIQNAQYCYGLACFGKLIGQIAAADQQAKAERQLAAALAALNVTPSTISEPIYTPYAFKKTTIHSTRTATIRYYVMDRRSGQYNVGTFADRSTSRQTVLYGLNAKDRNRATHLRSAVEEEAIVAQEAADAQVPTSKVMANYVAGGSEARPFKNLEAVRKDLESSRQQMAAAAHVPATTNAPAQDDPRFQSAVVIETPLATASGFYVAADWVLTNLHVVEDSKFVEIKRFDGTETFGKVIAEDPRLDLALISVQARGKSVQFFNGSSIPLGESVHAVGHPSGLEFSLTRGVISAVRELESKRAPGASRVKYIQTDTPINPGNSGGPLFLGKEVIGVNTGKLAATEIEGIGFAVHLDEVKGFLRRNGTQ